jgi:hypothetical protein
MISRLFGPLSDTTSNVAARPCASARVNIAGAANPAAVVAKKSRRFILDASRV